MNKNDKRKFNTDSDRSNCVVPEKITDVERFFFLQKFYSKHFEWVIESQNFSYNSICARNLLKFTFFSVKNALMVGSFLCDKFICVILCDVVRLLESLESV